MTARGEACTLVQDPLHLTAAGLFVTALRFFSPEISPPEARAQRVQPPEGRQIHGRLIWPPPTGAATPVVPGAEVGRPRNTRTAR